MDGHGADGDVQGCAVIRDRADIAHGQGCGRRPSFSLISAGAAGADTVDQAADLGDLVAVDIDREFQRGRPGIQDQRLAAHPFFSALWKW